MKQLALTNRKVDVLGHALVDDVDFLWAQQYRWFQRPNGYVYRNCRRGDKSYAMALHREVLGLKHGHRELVVDHIDGNPLNNTRENLRAVTYAVNAQNRKPRENCTSRHSGVSWYSSKGCWRVAIMVNGKRTLVGYFDDEEEAGRAAQQFYAEHVPGWVPRATTTAACQGSATASEGPNLTHSDHKEGSL